MSRGAILCQSSRRNFRSGSASHTMPAQFCLLGRSRSLDLHRNPGAARTEAGTVESASPGSRHRSRRDAFGELVTVVVSEKPCLRNSIFRLSGLLIYFTDSRKEHRRDSFPQRMALQRHRPTFVWPFDRGIFHVALLDSCEELLQRCREIIELYPCA